MTHHRVGLGLLVVICLFLPESGYAQSGLPVIPQAPISGTVQELPLTFLPDSPVSQSPVSGLLPVPAPLKASTTNQLPVPLPLQSPGANQLPLPAPLQSRPANLLPVPVPLQTTISTQPPIPPSPETFPPKEGPPATPIKEPTDRFKRPEGEPQYPESAFGPGHWHWSGWRYGPRVAPHEEYPGLGGGPQVTYPWGMPGYTGRNGECSLEKTCRLWGPPVPVYTPIPQPTDPKNLIYPGRNISSPGFVYGWIGPFPASPRYKHYAVNSWAQPGVDLSTGGPNSNNNKLGGGSNPSKPGGSMTISMKVPNPTAEVFVGGVKTTQTGTDRTFSSPDLEDGKEFLYEVTVRWIDQGVTHEKKKNVIITSGQVIALDFTAPEVVRAEK